MLSMNYDVNTGSEKLRPEDLLFRERPSTPQDAFLRARSWLGENWFVKMVHSGKVDFFNFGMQILPEDNTEGNRKKLKEFFRKDPKAKLDVHRYIREVWREWVLNQNVVSFWREEAPNKTVPFLLLGEQCKYSDAMGVPRLRVKLDYKHNQMPQNDDVFTFSNMTVSDVKNRYYSGREIELDEKYDEHFEVLTTGYRGRGFSLPDLYSIFRTLSQTESMEVGESMLALLSRRVTLQHKLGFELRGPSAGPNAVFQKDLSIWKKKRADAILNFFNGRFGFVETTSNFDHEIKLHYVDPKLFEEKRWGTVVTRLLWWAGPLGFMMVAKQPNPFLLGIFKAMSDAAREEVGPHLAYVINRGVPLPFRARLKWSNRCFYDMRLAWDMVMALMKQGPLSLTTALKEADFSPDLEEELKAKEAKSPAAFLPLHDPDHGQQPGVGSGRVKGGTPHAAGRPRSKADAAVKPTGVKAGR